MGTGGGAKSCSPRALRAPCALQQPRRVPGHGVGDDVTEGAHLVVAVRAVHQGMRQATVIGEKEQTLRLLVEAADVWQLREALSVIR